MDVRFAMFHTKLTQLHLCQAQMQQLQQRIMKEIVPKSTIDSQINGLAKRFADVEWNILRVHGVKLCFGLIDILNIFPRHGYH